MAQDDAEALCRHLAAAKQGHSLAQFNLDVVYINAQGVLQDPATKHMWFKISTANGDEYASGPLKSVEESMSPAAIEDAQLRAQVCLASDYRDCD